MQKAEEEKKISRAIVPQVRALYKLDRQDSRIV
jgi:hypothetical protein